MVDSKCEKLFVHYLRIIRRYRSKCRTFIMGLQNGIFRVNQDSFMASKSLFVNLSPISVAINMSWPIF